MNITNTEVFNFSGALRGMRNPYKSWDKSDSRFGFADIDTFYDEVDEVIYSYIKNEFPQAEIDDFEYSERWDELNDWFHNNGSVQYNRNVVKYDLIGYEDLKLAQHLVRASDEHAKFMRQILVSTDITAPRLWWAEMDTYKIATTANSTSTMHTLIKEPITTDMFECDLSYIVLKDIVEQCEYLRKRYLDTNDKRYWRALIEILPQSFLQTRTWTTNYAVLRNVYFQRRNHRLKEWHTFCDWIKELPYGKELITLEDINETY